jgi:hypothetical protein
MIRERKREKGDNGKKRTDEERCLPLCQWGRDDGGGG